MYGATAWLSHSAGPRLTSIMSRSVSGVVVRASPGENAPIVFTSTSGGPTSLAIRSMSCVATAGSVVSAASRRTLVGKLAQPALVPVDRHHAEAASGEGHRRRVTKRTACADHNRHVSAHGVDLPFGLGRGPARRVPVFRDGSQTGRKKGERDLTGPVIRPPWNSAGRHGLMPAPVLSPSAASRHLPIAARDCGNNSRGRKVLVEMTTIHRPAPGDSLEGWHAHQGRQHAEASRPPSSPARAETFPGPS